MVNIQVTWTQRAIIMNALVALDLRLTEALGMYNPEVEDCRGNIATLTSDREEVQKLMQYISHTRES